MYWHVKGGGGEWTSSMLTNSAFKTKHFITCYTLFLIVVKYIILCTFYHLLYFLYLLFSLSLCSTHLPLTQGTTLYFQQLGCCGVLVRSDKWSSNFVVLLYFLIIKLIKLYLNIFFFVWNVDINSLVKCTLPQPLKFAKQNVAYIDLFCTYCAKPWSISFSSVLIHFGDYKSQNRSRHNLIFYTG